MSDFFCEVTVETSEAAADIPPTAPSTLAATATTGNRLASLRLLRDLLAADLDTCQSMRDRTALAEQFRKTLDQIDAIERAQPAAEGTALDEFTRRRATKQAKGPASAASK